MREVVCVHMLQGVECFDAPDGEWGLTKRTAKVHDYSFFIELCDGYNHRKAGLVKVIVH
jgi:hypothetical protein